MSFPAYQAIGKDIGLGFASWKVYMHFVNDGVLNHTRPVDVKLTALASTIPLSRRKVREAVDWLTERGYVVEHGRDAHGVRSLSLAWALETRHAA